MKKLIVAAATGLSLLASQGLKADNSRVMIYLVDPKDDAAKKKLNPLDVSDDDESPTDVGDPQAEARKKEAQKKLDDLIAEMQKEDPKLAEKHKRIAKEVEREQREFIALLDQFVKVKFNKKDDDAEPEFVKSRTRITDLVFKAPTKRDYYERLFLINASWNQNQNEIERFQSLDKALQDRSLELEARHRQIRTIIMGATTVVGLALGGYLSYKASERIIPIVANEGGFSSVAKVLGRGTIVVVGAGVGAAAGAYVGFLGSDALFQNEREFIDPIEGNEDLREILDYIDNTNSKLPL